MSVSLRITMLVTSYCSICGKVRLVRLCGMDFAHRHDMELRRDDAGSTHTCKSCFKACEELAASNQPITHASMVTGQSDEAEPARIAEKRREAKVDRQRRLGELKADMLGSADLFVHNCSSSLNSTSGGASFLL